MNRILAPLTLLTLLTSASHALGDYGLYINTSIGTVIGYHDATVTYTNPIRGDAYGFNRLTGCINLALGYGILFHRFYFAAELGYIFGSINRTNGRDGGAVVSRSIKAESNWGAVDVAIRVGYQCAGKVIPYFRIGLEDRHFRMVHVTTNTVGPATYTEINGTSNKQALTPGVGIEYPFHRHLHVGLECRYALYPSISRRASVANGLGEIVTYNIKPRVFTSLLTFRYHF